MANYVAGERPEEAARALSSIEETSRGALREMRALLGVLRTEETPAQARRGTGPGAGAGRPEGAWSTGPPTPAYGSTWTSTATGRGCPPGWTWPRTG